MRHLHAAVVPVPARGVASVLASAAVALLVAGCSSSFESEATDTLTAPEGDTACFAADSAELEPGRSLCVDRVVGSRIEASGLAVDSILTVRGIEGDTMTLTVDRSPYVVDLDGKIVADTIEISGSWDDGSPLLLLVEQP